VQKMSTDSAALRLRRPDPALQPAAPPCADRALRRAVRGRQVGVPGPGHAPVAPVAGLLAARGLAFRVSRRGARRGARRTAFRFLDRRRCARAATERGVTGRCRRDVRHRAKELERDGERGQRAVPGPKVRVDRVARRRECDRAVRRDLRRKEQEQRDPQHACRTPQAEASVVLASHEGG
jgi:hypothetical protein